MARYVAVPGTWALKSLSTGSWFHPRSEFTRMLHALGLEPLRAEPFIWSTDINGAQGWRRWFRWLPWISADGDYNDWKAGGASLRWYIDTPPAVVIAHSHGGWVALHAAAQGLEIPVLVTVGTPVRRGRADQELVELARPNIGYWIHFYDPGDLTQLAGAGGDGHLANPFAASTHKFPAADLNVPHRFGHSDLLTNPQCYSLWQTQGWAALILKVLASPHVPSAAAPESPVRAA